MKNKVPGKKGVFPKTIMALQDKYDYNETFIAPSKQIFEDGEYVGVYELKEVKKAKVTLE